MIISRQYLPFYYRAVSNILWLMKAAVWSRNVMVPLEAVGEYFRIKSSIKRLPLSKSALAYLRANYGRLWY
ncbi:MAG TPA: hypothetical protein ENK06_12090 [Gammaproteobacteria bacterium]|nr:hypothetical protein [Gammaproteobacteria bacterium]